MKKAQGFPLIKTKMMIPAVRENLIHRSYLIDSVEKGIKQGFVLVSSPPGYGKTTLAADWAQQSSTPVVWLTLDSDDNDLLILNRYLSALFTKFFSNPKNEINDFQMEGDPLLTYQTILVSLINSCVEMTSEITLVLDDYHVIENPQIHKGIFFLLEHLPAHVRVILVTRSDPPFSLARFRANSRILEIRAADLEFSYDEVKQFLTQTQQMDLEESEISQIYNTTEGWITGLQLASLVHNETRMFQLSDFTLSSDANLTLEYMVDEVLSQQTLPVQDFLLRTSILENLYGPLCNYVLNTTDTIYNSQGFLHSLYHANLFLSPLDNKEHWFRYHSLFAGTLRHLLAEQYPKEIPTLYKRASEWCDQNGYFEEALSYANKTNEPSQIIFLLEKYSVEAITQNRIFDILGRIRRTDETLLASSPILSLIYSWGCLFTLDMDSSEIWLEKARDLMTGVDHIRWTKPVEDAFWGLIAAGQSILEAAHGENDKAMALSKQALSLLPEGNDYSHSFALLNQAITLSINSDTEKAIQVLDETIRISQKSGNWFVMLIARSNLGEIYISSGQLSKALVVFEQSRNLFSTMPGMFSAYEGFIYKELADIYLTRNQLGTAEEYFQKSIILNSRMSSPLNDFDTHIRLAHLFHCKADYRHANEEINLARELSSKSQATLDDMIVNLTEVKWSLLRGQILPAQKWLQSIGLTDHSNFDKLNGYPKPIAVSAQLICARLNLVQGQLTNNPEKVALAAGELDQIIRELIDGNLGERLIEAYILSAFTSHELRKTNEMISSLKNALKLAETEEFRQVFIDEGIPMSRLLSLYLTVIKQNKTPEDLLTRGFVADLLFRLTGKNIERENIEKLHAVDPEESIFLVELLTSRESEILQLVAKGRTNNEIAMDLCISVNTVKRHLNNTFMKLGVSTRTQAIRVAQSQGLIN